MASALQLRIQNERIRPTRQWQRDAPAGTHACDACGSSSVELDEVVHRVRLQLGECNDCGHRWTRELHQPAGRLMRTRRIGVEAAAAA